MCCNEDLCLIRDYWRLTWRRAAPDLASCYARSGVGPVGSKRVVFCSFKTAGQSWGGFLAITLQIPAALQAKQAKKPEATGPGHRKLASYCNLQCMVRDVGYSAPALSWIKSWAPPEACGGLQGREL